MVCVETIAFFVPLECEKDGRHQVAQRFAHPSTRFDYQMLSFLQRLRDPSCHLLLLWTELEILCFRERAVLGKEAADAFHEFAAQIVFQCDHFLKIRSVLSLGSC